MIGSELIVYFKSVEMLVSIKIVIAFVLHFVFSQECGSGPNFCHTEIKYRSLDGSCNNLKNPKWGSAGSEYGRILPANFSDSKLFGIKRYILILSL